MLIRWRVRLHMLGVAQVPEGANITVTGGSEAPPDAMPYSVQPLLTAVLPVADEAAAEAAATNLATAMYDTAASTFAFHNASTSFVFVESVPVIRFGAARETHDSSMCGADSAGVCTGAPRGQRRHLGHSNL